MVDNNNISEEYDNDVLTVERHPGAKSPYWLMLSIFVFYIGYKLLVSDDSKLDVVIESVTHNQDSTSSIDMPSYSAANIHQLVSAGNIEEIKSQLLLIDEQEINKVVGGMTPIMLAASMGKTEIIDLLFTQGADPNKRGSMKRTALQYVTEKNHIESAKRLLSYGADIDAYDNGRLTPLTMAASRGHTELGLIFINKGADVNIQHSQGWTALIDAVAHDNIKLAKALLKAGANKDLKGKDGLKAIDYARQYGHKRMVKLLGKNSQ
jgi:ankyrin repeat protein